MLKCKQQNQKIFSLARSHLKSIYVTPETIVIKNTFAIKQIILTALVLAQTEATYRFMFRDF